MKVMSFCWHSHTKLIHWNLCENKIKKMCWKMTSDCIELEICQTTKATYVTIDYEVYSNWRKYWFGGEHKFVWFSFEKRINSKIGATTKCYMLSWSEPYHVKNKSNRFDYGEAGLEWNYGGESTSKSYLGWVNSIRSALKLCALMGQAHTHTNKIKTKFSIKSET